MEEDMMEPFWSCAVLAVYLNRSLGSALIAWINRVFVAQLSVMGRERTSLIQLKVSNRKSSFTEYYLYSWQNQLSVTIETHAPLTTSRGT
jgi:hypothetical protein